MKQGVSGTNGNLQFIKWTGPSWVILVPNLFLSKPPNFATLYDYFLYPKSCLYHSYWMCELQLDWVAHGKRDLILSLLVSFRAFVYCWLQILLGGIHQLLSWVVRSARLKAIAGTSFWWHKELPGHASTLWQGQSLSLALSLNSRMSGLLNRADKRLEVNSDVPVPIVYPR